MNKMHAMAITELGEITPESEVLSPIEVPVPHPGDEEVLIAVSHCGVCHTELDEIEGRTPPEQLPRIPGHQVVGEIVEKGTGLNDLHVGQRVGVAWIYSSCGRCEHCRCGNDNLCDAFVATGRDRDGGYAEYMLAPADYVYPIPAELDSLAAAPLLCAGAIGYRSLRLSGMDGREGQRLGLTGFGASGHLVLKLARAVYPVLEIFVFARDADARQHALDLGATWAGATQETPPAKLHAIIDTTPAWQPVLAALEALLPGGRLVINAIRKEAGDQQALAEIDYASQLWMEKEIKTVANVSRRDVREFLALAAQHQLAPEVTTYSLQDAATAIKNLKFASQRGAAVLVM